jgi:hypothetical protein
MKTFNKIALLLAVCWSAVLATGCTDATVASHNLSKAAEQFQLERRIVFYNGITGEYMLSMEGRCSVEQNNARLAVTCKIGPEEYKKHYLGLSDNVTYFSEQVDTANVSAYHYKVIFKPQAIAPDIDLKTSVGG